MNYRRVQEGRLGIDRRREGEQTLEEGGWNVVALEFYFVFVTTAARTALTVSRKRRWSPVAAYAVAASEGGGVISMAQRRADIRSKV